MANTRIERVLRHDGIVAVLDWFTNPARGHEPHWVGDDRWHPIVHEAVKLRQISGESSVRVLVGEHAVLVSGDENHVVGVVFIKGHPVVKSVVRMVRQLLRPVGVGAGASKSSAPKSNHGHNLNKDSARKGTGPQRPPNLPPQMNNPVPAGPMGMPPRPGPGMPRGPMGMPPAGPPMGMPPGMGRAPMGMPPGMHPGNRNHPGHHHGAPNPPQNPGGRPASAPMPEPRPGGGAAANQGPNNPPRIGGGPMLLPPPLQDSPRDDGGPKK